MATTDEDTTQTAPPPAPAAAYDPSAINAMLQQLQAPLPNVQPDTTPVKRGWLSLLGEALGGGTQIPMSPADKEQSGLRALGDFGTGLMKASRYQPGQTLFSNLAGGFDEAERSLVGSQRTAAGTLAARQEYQQQQQEQQLARIKEALPLLNLQATLGRTAAIAAQPNPLAPGGGTGGSIATGGSIGAPVLARDPSVTAGQQGNNPGNVMLTPGAPLPAGATGAVPVTGGRYAAAFPDVPTGVAAHSDTLNGYKAAGVNTIEDAVKRWVGDPKADLTSYTADVAKAAGVDPKAPVDLSDPKIQRAFILAQQPHESGKSWLSPADVDKGLALAAARRQPAKPGAPGQLPPTIVASSSTAPAPAGGAKPPAPAPAPAPGTPPPPSPTDSSATTAAPSGGTAVPGGAPSPTAAAPPAPGTPAQISGLVAPPGVPVPLGATAAPQPPAPDTRPDSALTWPEYQTKYTTPLPADAVAKVTVTPDPKALADAEKAKNAAYQALQNIRSTPGADQTKAIAQYNTANDAVNTLRQDAAKATADNVKTLLQNQQSELGNNYRKVIELAGTASEGDKQRAAAVALKTQEGTQALELEKVKSGQTWHQKLQEQAATYAQDNTIKPMAAASAKSHQMNLGLQQMLPILQDLPPSGGPLGSVLNAHPDLAPLFNTAGIINDKQADAVRLINGLVANVSSEMKPTGLGALREYEWDAFKAQLPSMLSSKDGQMKAVAFMMNMNNRIQAEHNWTNTYFNRKVPDETAPGKTVPAHNLDSDDPAESVQQRMDRELGPIIPTYSGPPSRSGQEAWEQSLPPGKPYYKTWTVTDPKTGQLQRNQDGSPKITRSLEVRPWQ